MRDIEFRGKRIDNGKWIMGSFVSYSDYDNDKAYLIYTSNGNPNSVDPSTVGQYTGLNDKDRTKIFEGDIVVVNIKGRKTVCEVAYAEVVAHFQLWQFDTLPHTPTSIDFGNYTCEVIGNIHDNPELLRSDTE